MYVKGVWDRDMRSAHGVRKCPKCKQVKPFTVFRDCYSGACNECMDLEKRAKRLAVLYCQSGEFITHGMSGQCPVRFDVRPEIVVRECRKYGYVVSVERVVELLLRAALESEMRRMCACLRKLYRIYKLPVPDHIKVPDQRRATRRERDRLTRLRRRP